MTGWVVRGIGMCLVNVGVRILLGAAVTQWPLHGSQMRWLGLATVLLVVIVWAALDGIRDRRANPDPDDSADLAMVWLKAAVFAGLTAGAITWFLQLIVDFSLGQNTLVFELTSGAAFTILLVFIPATAAVFFGRMLANREAKKKLEERDKVRAEHHHHVGAASAPQQRSQWSDGDANADTEVFQAVDPDAGDPRKTR